MHLVVREVFSAPKNDCYHSTKTSLHQCNCMNPQVFGPFYPVVLLLLSLKSQYILFGDGLRGLFNFFSSGWRDGRRGGEIITGKEVDHSESDPEEESKEPEGGSHSVSSSTTPSVWQPTMTTRGVLNWFSPPRQTFF